jgi:glycosyltransferase involved in cell wall biosynthesis
MKVAHLCQSSDTRIGGSGAVARDLVANQAELGIDARLIYLYGRPDESNQRAAGIPSEYLNIDRASRYTRGVAALRRALREFEPDVIHHHDGLLWTRLVTPSLGVPLITHGHSEAPQDWMKRALQRFALRGTTYLLAVSDWTARTWIDAGFPRQKIVVVPNGVNCMRFHRRSEQVKREMKEALRIDAQAHVLLWAGRLERGRKGLDRLLYVARKLPAGWVCVVAGDGTDYKWLSSEAEMLPSPSQFKMLGNVVAAEEWFGVSDAYLFTSPIEPFGLVLIEAAASELPIIGFPCEGGGMELLEQLDADIVDESNTSNLDAIFSGLPAPVRGAKGRQIVEEFYSSTAVADKTISIYRALTTASPNKPQLGDSGYKSS